MKVDIIFIDTFLTLRAVTTMQISSLTRSSMPAYHIITFQLDDILWYYYRLLTEWLADTRARYFSQPPARWCFLLRVGYTFITWGHDDWFDCQGFIHIFFAHHGISIYQKWNNGNGPSIIRLFRAMPILPFLRFCASLHASLLETRFKMRYRRIAQVSSSSFRHVPTPAAALSQQFRPSRSIYVRILFRR